MTAVRLQIHQIMSYLTEPKRLSLVLDETIQIHHLAETIKHVEMPCSSNAMFPAHYLFTLNEVRDDDRSNSDSLATRASARIRQRTSMDG